MSEYSRVFFQHCRILSGVGYIDFVCGSYERFKITTTQELTRTYTMLEF